MRISENYSKAYFKAEDFDSDGRVLVISSVEMEQVGREQKLTAYFKDEDKALPLNKTNAETIAELYGDETDDWSGHAICIRQEKTQFENKRVACMRVVDRRYKEQDGVYTPIKESMASEGTASTRKADKDTTKAGKSTSDASA